MVILSLANLSLVEPEDTSEDFIPNLVDSTTTPSNIVFNTFAKAVAFNELEMWLKEQIQIEWAFATCPIEELFAQYKIEAYCQVIEKLHELKGKNVK